MKYQLFQTVEIDGENILVPSPEALSRLAQGEQVEGVSVHPIHRLGARQTMVSQYPELSLGFRKCRDAWVPLFLLCLDGQLRRVHLEEPTCNRCGWQGLTANATVFDLFIGFPDWAERLRRAAELPRPPCPRCGAKLPREAMWIAPDQM